MGVLWWRTRDTRASQDLNGRSNLPKIYSRSEASVIKIRSRISFKVIVIKFSNEVNSKIDKALDITFSNKSNEVFNTFY